MTIPGPWVYEPEHAQVLAGEPVTFRNDGGAAHTITFESIDLDVNIQPGDETIHVFDEPGSYAYSCKYHPPDMKGTILVLPKES